MESRPVSKRAILLLALLLLLLVGIAFAAFIRNSPSKRAGGQVPTTSTTVLASTTTAVVTTTTALTTSSEAVEVEPTILVGQTIYDDSAQATPNELGLSADVTEETTTSSPSGDIVADGAQANDASQGALAFGSPGKFGVPGSEPTTTVTRPPSTVRNPSRSTIAAVTTTTRPKPTSTTRMTNTKTSTTVKAAATTSVVTSSSVTSSSVTPSSVTTSVNTSVTTSSVTTTPAGPTTSANVSTTTTLAPSASFTITGNAVTTLRPGRSSALDLTVNNPNPFPIKVDAIDVSFVGTPNCDGPKNYTVSRPFVGPLTIPSGTSKIAWSIAPEIAMLNLPTNQDGCQATDISLRYVGQATVP